MGALLNIWISFLAGLFAPLGAVCVLPLYPGFLAYLLVVAGYFIRKRVRKRLLKKKIKKMQVEMNVLIDLMKKAQSERFKYNKISGIVYNIRIKKYKQRIGKIKQRLPVLEGKLMGDGSKKEFIKGKREGIKK
jgi:hypothetical protein|tara:strand:+ start:340 stop:738 length:399 start_codon:yes stop_codon:yes gene_type:complete